jgi:hypothetical protein
MTAKKKGAKPKKMGVKKESLRKGQLSDKDAGEVAGGTGGGCFQVGLSIGCCPGTMNHG